MGNSNNLYTDNVQNSQQNHISSLVSRKTASYLYIQKHRCGIHAFESNNRYQMFRFCFFQLHTYTESQEKEDFILARITFCRIGNAKALFPKGEEGEDRVEKEVDKKDSLQCLNRNVHVCSAFT